MKIWAVYYVDLNMTLGLKWLVHYRRFEDNGHYLNAMPEHIAVQQQSQPRDPLMDCQETHMLCAPANSNYLLCLKDMLVSQACKCQEIVKSPTNKPCSVHKIRVIYRSVPLL